MIRFPAVAAALSLCLASSPGVAQTSDPNLGRSIAANCANCHGTDGRSVGGMPSLAGRPREALVQTLKEFRDGKRPATIMHQLSKGYSDAQIDAVAAYFASQKAR
ncbi:MAG: cytochrome C [Betaproteobacteria bacterium RIFCSPLOWO2_12_FULL_62_13b]|nr:MAG: cytochrome C [Betaproteobacteria bacterium RIFCSPLOWO2_12_FULL_62_13b]